MPSYSIVIPLYNEEACVKQSVVDIVNSLDEEFRGGYELILVVNGSQDRTGEMCESLAVSYSSIRVVRVERNLGYGGGIIRGIEEASGSYVGFTCSDGQVSPEDLKRVMREIGRGTCDLVKARRTSRADGLVRKVNSACYNSLFRLLFGMRTCDINAMPKLWRRDVLRFLDLTSRDWFIDAEIMIKARCLDLRVHEIPIHYLKRAGGKSVVRVSAVWEFLRNAFFLIASGRLRSWRRSVVGSRGASA